MEQEMSDIKPSNKEKLWSNNPFQGVMTPQDKFRLCQDENHLGDTPIEFARFLTSSTFEYLQDFAPHVLPSIIADFGTKGESSLIDVSQRYLQIRYPEGGELKLYTFYGIYPLLVVNWVDEGLVSDIKDLAIKHSFKSDFMFNPDYPIGTKLLVYVDYARIKNGFIQIDPYLTEYASLNLILENPSLWQSIQRIFLRKTWNEYDKNNSLSREDFARQVDKLCLGNKIIDSIREENIKLFK